MRPILLSGLLLAGACGGSPAKDVADADTDFPEDETDISTDPVNLLTPAREWTAAHAEDNAGWRLGVGDLTAGGPGSILVSAPSTTVMSAGIEPQGALYVVDHATPSGALDAVAESSVPGHYNGDVVASDAAVVGDMFGDGTPDVAIFGIIDEGPPFQAVAVFSTPLPVVADVRSSHAQVSLDRQKDGAYPQDVAACGDVNGDEHDDLCIGGFSNPAVGGDDGAFIFYGPLSAGDNPVSSASVTLRAPGGEGAGQTLESGTDLTGDGLLDVLYGAINWNEHRGGAYLVSDPPTGVVDFHDLPFWEGDDIEGNAGGSLAVGGDVDGDGLDDFFVASNTAEGRRGQAFVVTTKEGGLLKDAYVHGQGDDIYDWFGASGAIADFDDDGEMDLAIGISRDFYLGFDEPGRVAIYHGPLSPGAITEADADLVFSGSSAPDAFGFQMAAGQIDGVGGADLVVAAPFDSRVGVAAGAVYLYTGDQL